MKCAVYQAALLEIKTYQTIKTLWSHYYEKHLQKNQKNDTFLLIFAFYGANSSFFL